MNLPKKKEEKKYPYIIGAKELFELVKEYQDYSYVSDKRFYFKEDKTKAEYSLSDGLYFIVTKTFSYPVDTGHDIEIIDTEYSFKVLYRDMPLSIEETNIYLEKLVPSMKEKLEANKVKNKEELLYLLDKFKGVKD